MEQRKKRRLTRLISGCLASNFPMSPSLTPHSPCSRQDIYIKLDVDASLPCLGADVGSHQTRGRCRGPVLAEALNCESATSRLKQRISFEEGVDIGGIRGLAHSVVISEDLKQQTTSRWLVSGRHTAKKGKSDALFPKQTGSRDDQT